MIVDPVEAFKKTTATVPIPTSSVAPVPTVVPSLPEYQTASETGNRTLWYVQIPLGARCAASVSSGELQWSQTGFN